MPSSLSNPEKTTDPTNVVVSEKSSRLNKRGAPVMSNGVFWAATPALALLGLTVLSSRGSLPLPIGPAENSGASPQNSIISARDWIVPASQTILVSNQSVGDYVVLRGRLEAVGGDKITSSTSGEVAQTLVQPGQLVKAGQKIVLLTTGVAPPEQTSSPLDQWQSRAESAQIAAAQQQEQLESRMAAANKELERAKQRVEVAQKRVTEARELIAQLQRGEEVSSNPIETKPARSQSESRARAEARKAALRESQKLQDDASRAEQQAQAAQNAARKAQEQVTTRQQKLQAGQVIANNAAGQKSNQDKLPENEVVGAVQDEKESTQAVTEARQALATAQSNAAMAQREATRLQARARETRNKANEAARRATQDLQLFEEQAGSKSTSAEPVRNASGKITIADAALIARNAMKESEEAIADAERIRRRIEDYSRPVQRTRRRFEKATQELEAAQRRIWENVPQMRTTQSAITATRDGVVTWVAAGRTIVKPGEALATIGRPDHLEVVITDKTGIWKSLKPNAQVLALVQRRQISPTMSTDSGSRRLETNIPSMARVLAVAPPVGKNGTARVRIAVHNPPRQGGNNQNGLSPRAFAPGMPVFFSVSKPSTRQPGLRIPTAAVRRGEGGKTYVAVLSPLMDGKQLRPGGQCRVEWREVFLAPGDGEYNRVKFGLEVGERVALRPAELYSFTLAYGEQATVRVEQI